MAPLGRVTHYFETLLFLCKLVFFNYNFHKNTKSRQKRFVSKQGQPRPHTQLKARLLTEQLKNDLFLRLHHSAHYYRLAILPIVILTLLVNMFFLRKFPQYPFSLIFINPASVLSHIDSKQTKQINGVKFVNIGFRSVGVITSASHAEGRQFNPGRKQERCIFFLFCSRLLLLVITLSYIISFCRKRHISERFYSRMFANLIRLTKPTLL